MSFRIQSNSRSRNVIDYIRLTQPMPYGRYRYCVTKGYDKRTTHRFDRSVDKFIILGLS